MLTADYEKGYISAFVKIFAVLKEEYEVYIKHADKENYEIEIKKINEEEISEYLSICFQKQNGSLTIISHKNISEEIIKKVIKDVSLALNENPLANYSFKDLNDHTVYHYVYVKEKVIIDNKKLLKDALKNGEIQDLNFNLGYVI